jgi:two-component system, sensor histidine kinase and response regulator
MSSIKVLIVDDDPSVREVFQEMLLNEGYEAITTGSAIEALKEGEKTRFDLLMTDIRMPEMDGLELVRKFREQNPQIGSILITGYPDVETARAGIQQGVYDYIVKPIGKDELCRAVRDALKKQQRILMLERTSHELEELEETRAKFVNVLAHELRTSLTPVLGCAEMLADQLKDKPEKTQDTLAHMLFNSAKGMRLQLENMLILTRLETGDFVPLLVLVDTKALLRQAASQIEPLAIDKRQQFDLELADDLPAIRVDRLCFAQVVTNLLENAIKFTPEEGRIRLKAAASGGELIVRVQDTGRSLSVEEQQRLLQPYWKSEVDRLRLPGTGLGLAICQRLIEIHKGKIWIENGPGEGKAFIFSLPLEAPGT